MTAKCCPITREICDGEYCAWWDAALEQCAVVAIKDLLHSMYGGERASH